MSPPATQTTNTHPPRLVGLLIGGGHGRRAGGPKALRIIDDDLAWHVQARALLAAGCDSLVAVLHPDAWTPAHRAIAPTEGMADLFCVRADPDAPMFASVQLGLRAVVRTWGCGTDGTAPPIALLPVDCPMPKPEVLRALSDAAQAAESTDATLQPWLIARPYVQTANGPRFGHPLLLPARAAGVLAASDAATTRLDHWIAALASGQRLDVAVTDDGILANHNGPGHEGRANGA